ncbi:MAG: pentapeptide repeat-containing protein, partial [Pseudomonadota bacterium]
AAELRGANLRGAALQGAYLGGAVLQGADLEGAKLQGANLFAALLLEADLSGADLHGADLRRAGFDTSSQCSGTFFTAVGLRGVDASMLDLSQDQVNSMFGDRGTVTLPEGIEVPEHWKTFASWQEFDEAWKVEKAKHGLAD